MNLRLMRWKNEDDKIKKIYKIDLKIIKISSYV
jgi:hypothetical protein